MDEKKVITIFSTQKRKKVNEKNLKTSFSSTENSAASLLQCCRAAASCWVHRVNTILVVTTEIIIRHSHHRRRQSCGFLFVAVINYLLLRVIIAMELNLLCEYIKSHQAVHSSLPVGHFCLSISSR